MKSAHEDLLRSVTLGEFPADAPEILDAAREDPEFAEALRETRVLLGALDASGAIRAEIIEDASKQDDAPGQELVAPFVHAQLAGVRKSRWRVVVAAAAILMGGSVIWWMFGESRRGSDTDWDQPLGSTADITNLTFDANRMSFGWQSNVTLGEYRVRVFDLTSGDEVLQSELTAENTWQPNDEERPQLPAEFEWEVLWYLEGTHELTAGPVSGSR